MNKKAAAIAYLYNDNIQATYGTIKQLLGGLRASCKWEGRITRIPPTGLPKAFPFATRGILL